MGNVSINVTEVVSDIRAGMSDVELKEKYGLNSNDLFRLKNELLLRRHITRSDLRFQKMASIASSVNLDVKGFLRDFRTRPDDLFLMAKYGLVAMELQEIYVKLIQGRFLTEYEYEHREVIAPELINITIAPPPATSLVDSEDAPMTSASSVRYAPQSFGLPADFFRDFSGIKIGESSGDQLISVGEVMAHNDGIGERGSDKPSRKNKKNPEDLCPNCGHPKHSLSADSCPSCGIVYAKFQKRR